MPPGFNFGATPAPAQQTQAAQPGQLGQPAQSGFSFGATSLAQPTLGATAPASAQAAAPAFSFGATTTAAQPAQSGFNFSAPASAAPTQPAGLFSACFEGYESLRVLMSIFKSRRHILQLSKKFQEI